MSVSATLTPPESGDAVSPQIAADSPSADIPSPAADRAQAEPAPPQETSADAAREQTVALIERAGGLPPALRERLLAAVANQPQVSLAQMIAAVEETLPEYLRAPGSAAQPVHPMGEAFFSGAAGELSDNEAEALAQQQLARAGLLRGQRVRLNDQ